MRSRTLRIASSWWLTALFCLLLMATYIVAVAFDDHSFSRWTSFLLHSPAGLTLYCGLAVNIALAGIRIVVLRLREPEHSREGVLSMDTWFAVPATGAEGTSRAAAWMAARGFPPTVAGSSVSAVQGKYSFLPGTILRAGLVLLFAALLISAHTRSTGDLVLHEGDQGDLSGETVALRTIHAPLPPDYLQVGDESSFKVTEVSAVLTAKGTDRTITPGWPARIAGRYCRIIHFGYTQQLTVTTATGSFSKTLDLDVLPPGKSQIITPASSGLLLTLSLQPDKTISKGLLTGKQYDLATPRYRIIVQKGGTKTTPLELSLRSGEQATAQGTALALGKDRRFITLHYAVDPALPFIYAGLLLFLGGSLLMLSRFFWYRKEMAAVVDGDRLLIGFREEFYRKWGILQFHRSKDGLS
jgi:hypothetical protein